MGKRRLSREIALQVLYAHQMTRAPLKEIEKNLFELDPKREHNYGEFGHELVERVINNVEKIDEVLQPAILHWRLERLCQVDKQLLRMATCELLLYEDIPMRVTLNEYIELAKGYGTDDSPAFINGILDKLAKDHKVRDYFQSKVI